jgi:hypothetical protein
MNDTNEQKETGSETRIFVLKDVERREVERTERSG